MTVVRIRDTVGNVVHWDATVHYDEWGEPYARAGLLNRLFGEKCAMWWNLKLHPNGTCGMNLDWKHKSGPKVDFSRSDRGWR